MRTLEAAYPEPRGDEEDEYLASRITRLAEELGEAILDYRTILGEDAS